MSSSPSPLRGGGRGEGFFSSLPLSASGRGEGFLPLGVPCSLCYTEPHRRPPTPARSRPHGIQPFRQATYSAPQALEKTHRPPGSQGHRAERGHSGTCRRAAGSACANKVMTELMVGLSSMDRATLSIPGKSCAGEPQRTHPRPFTWRKKCSGESNNPVAVRSTGEDHERA